VNIQTATSCEPLNFSRVDTTLSEEELRTLFPKYCQARSRRIEVTLKAGEMLYIPAGWFHEVRSVGAAAVHDEEGGHMALNYWFHPPDSEAFSSPYSKPFWQRDWDNRNAN
jgi:ribosomal protein L16 Arg81 hydroxylase